jgi:hypothetical protein
VHKPSASPTGKPAYPIASPAGNESCVA